MPTFERSIEVPASRDALFWWMQDYARRLEWDTFLTEARLIDAERAAVGVRAWCVDRAGRGMETEYVSFRPPERVAVRMTKGPWMFRSFAGSWAYQAIDAERTRVVFRYHVEARPRLGWLTDAILGRVFAREMAERLETLRSFAERGLVPPRAPDAP
ncbi:MAG: SRPBCC family protein [Myxococcota bacterium]|nr:SRPBCC family protein [Myxococcota bacterium]